MELTPSVLVAIGRVPGQGLLRFKFDSVWRPDPVRRFAQAVIADYRDPMPDGPAADLMRERLQLEGEWLPPVGEEEKVAALAAALRRVRDQSLSARQLELINRTPGYSARVLPWHEWFAPEVCVLADLTDGEPGWLDRAIETVHAVYNRPIIVVLAFPAPHDAGWPRARDWVNRALAAFGPDRVARFWLASRERETGDVLTPHDLADALAQFCHLFAYSGWSASPDLTRWLFGNLSGQPEEESRLATYGVSAWRAPIHHLLVESQVGTAVAMTERLLAEPDATELNAVADQLTAALEQARVAAQEQMTALPLPPGNGDLTQWMAEMRVHWWPAAQERVAQAMGASLDPLVDQAANPDQPAAARKRRLESLLAAIGQGEAVLHPPEPPPNLEPDFGAVANAREELARWAAILANGVAVVVVAMGFTMGYLNMSYWLPTLAATSGMWGVGLGVRQWTSWRHLKRQMARRDQRLADWVRAKAAMALFAGEGEALSILRGRALERLELEERRAANLQQARAILDRQRAVNEGLPRESMVARSVDASVPIPPVRPMTPQEPDAMTADEIALDLLRRTDFAGGSGEPLRLSEPDRAIMAEALLAAQGRHFGPAPLLMPVRAILPSTAGILPRDGFVLTGVPRPAGLATADAWFGDDPFLLARFSLTTAFMPDGSARTEAVAGGRGSSR